MNFMSAFSISMKNVIGILIGIAINLYRTLGSMTIWTILILPTQEYGRLVSFQSVGSVSATVHLENLRETITTYNGNEV